MMFGPMLEGMTVCGGVAIGRVRVRGWELERPAPTRVPVTQLDREIERFRQAVGSSAAEVEALRARLEGELGEMESRILSVHLAYLQDNAFLKDVENRIRGEQLRLEDALAQAVRDFDRIFELVESERMKERALDLRDVALRVIRNLDMTDAGSPSETEEVVAGPYIVATHKLSISDLFGFDHEQVLGVISEQGGPNSHAAIFARSMGIPAVTGIEDLRDRVRDGDYVILDAGTGVVHVNPDERLRREYEVRVDERRAEAPFEAAGPVELGDGTRIRLYGSCGNLGEVSQAMDAGLDGVGIYRTELLFLVDRQGPGEDLLVRHYSEVLTRSDGKRVAFRLLDLSLDQRIGGLRKHLEQNPALGRKGVRLLLVDSALLRLQLRALLRLVPGGTVHLLVPFVSTVQDLMRVKEAIRGERANLVKTGVPCADRVRLGAVIEIPASALHVSSLVSEADFLVVALDDLQQYVLAADRDNLQVEDYYRNLHPSLFRLLASLAKEAAEGGRELILFGEAAGDPLRLPFYVGVGYRHLSVAPVRSQKVRSTLAAWTEAAARQLADRILAAPTSLEVQRILLEAER